jgi:hypothetical protein
MLDLIYKIIWDDNSGKNERVIEILVDWTLHIGIACFFVGICILEKD